MVTPEYLTVAAIYQNTEKEEGSASMYKALFFVLD